MLNVSHDGGIRLLRKWERSQPPKLLTRGSHNAISKKQISITGSA
jgi:hypothetical protein